MKNKISKFGIAVLAVSIMLPSFGLSLRAEGNQNTSPIVLQLDNSIKPLVLDLKDALDVKNLSEAQLSAGNGQTTVAPSKPEARVKSFTLREKVSRNPPADSGLLGASDITVSSAIADPVGTGVNWLKNNQNTQGSWGQNSRTAVVDTATVLSLFHYIAEVTSSLAYQKALDWFNSTYPENSNYLAEKTVALAGAGQDVSSLSEFLASQMNEQDLGFGYQRNYQSEIAITAKALKAITAANYLDPGSDPTFTLRATLYYLLLSQNPNGSWPKTRGGQSDVKTTALVLESLQPYQDYILGGAAQGDIIIKTKIDLGLNYLKNVQNANGSWQDVVEKGVRNLLFNLKNRPNGDDN